MKEENPDMFHVINFNDENFINRLISVHSIREAFKDMTEEELEQLLKKMFKQE